MARILEKRLLRQPDVFYFKVAAPLISRKAKAGQFVIVRLHEKGERIPLSLADIDPQNGTISLIVMAVGKTTHEMVLLKQGDDILDLCGPLGQPTHIESIGRVVLVGGGFGVAPLYPIARAFKAAGNEVVVIMGARSRDLLIYEEEMRAIQAALKQGQHDKVPSLMSDKWLRDCTLFGSVAEVREGLEAWYATGVKTPILVPSSTKGGQLVALQELFDAFT